MYQYYIIPICCSSLRLCIFITHCHSASTILVVHIECTSLQRHWVRRIRVILSLSLICDALYSTLLWQDTQVHIDLAQKIFFSYHVMSPWKLKYVILKN